ncbi:Ig-like domain-containing protein [Paenibacillus sp. LHD-117]|uniref:glycoside hydrolase domain-containing protein n=1 Tax=Paenibacillus sp. LHD-117 TaxID=3071412 RepID=UPI0027DF2540|nr:glycoside hydrolase domain-containing protein [Paenibacillus sp. LHD-117]MDQ6422949.1 Ig-like domain-containing protein [Paenibacillus sp. LHD-117]
MNKLKKVTVKLFHIVLAAVMVLSTVLTANPAVGYAESTSSIVVDDTVTSGDHYFTYTAAADVNGSTGWAADRKSSIIGIEEAKTQHWVWNTNYEEARKHTYSFTFKGTGVELYGVKNDPKNTFQLDDQTPETLLITGAANTETLLYSKKGLTNGIHTVNVTLPEGGTGLQVSYARVYDDEVEVEVETTEILHTKTTGTNNYFTFSGNWAAGNAEHTWSNPLGANPSDTYYEVNFIGHKIDIYAGKNRPMGKVRYLIDGVEIGVFSLYNSSNINSTLITTVSGLTDGPHVLRAEATGEKEPNATGTLIDSAKVVVYHSPYQVSDIVLSQDNITLIEGSQYQMNFTVVPDYADIRDRKYSSSDTNIATVSTNGLVQALSAGTATITISSLKHNLSKTLTVTVTEGNPQMHGSIVDTNSQFTQDRYNEVKNLGVVNKSIYAWKNDKAVSEIALISLESGLRNVSVQATDFVSGTNTLSAIHITTTYIKSTQAYTGMPGYGSKTRPVPEGNRAESNDILYQTTPIQIPFNAVQPVWVEFDVPKDTPSGTYAGKIIVTADKVDTPIEFTYNLEVLDAMMPDAEEFKDGFDIELWQAPYSVAEYYGVEPFSQKHLEILLPHMEKYKQLGGHAITTTIVDDAWDGQTYSANEIHYPSMIKWTKKTDGTFTFDYSDFDAWVNFNKTLGLGDKIVAYGIAPWHNSFTYYDEAASRHVSASFSSVGTGEYNRIWKLFLNSFVEHLEEKGWFDHTYLGIDERGFSAAIFDLIDSVKGIHGDSLKTAGAMDAFVAKKDLGMRVDDLSVGTIAVKAHPTEFAQFIMQREALGLRTTIYSCTGHIPGNFSLSSPAESYWTMMYSYAVGGEGYLRWAYDSWVENPLEDTTHNAFEAGDTFLIFPDERTASNPTSKSSVRLEKMAEGVRDVNKLILMKKEVPAMNADVDRLLVKIKPNYSSSGYYLSAAGKTQIAADMDQIRQEIKTLTSKYIQMKNNPVPIESIAIQEGAETSVGIGATKQLHAILTPANSSNPAVTWTSANEVIASVDSNGIVTGKSVGTVTITVASQADPTKTASIQVIVERPKVDPEAQVSYYSFDHVTANTITDSWGLANGTLTGGTIVEGMSGNAIQFAKEDKVEITSPVTLTKDWTVSFWVKDSGSNETASALWDGKSFTGNQLSSTSIDVRRDSTESKMAVHVPEGFLTFNYLLEKNSWKHVTVTSNASNLNLYIDGLLKATIAWNQNVKTPLLAPTKIIGGRGFSGILDEVKVFNRTLTPDEVKTLNYVNGLNISEMSKELYIGDSYQIQAELISDNPDKSLTYTSSHPQVVTVNESGIVNAISKGDATITVENAAGGYKKTIAIKVAKHLNIQYSIPQYHLDDEYITTIENGKGTERQYLGQPDMVMLSDNKTLITAYPIGHGKGPLVLQMSYDAGETWVEKETPASWAKSQETPTIYKLNMSNGKERLILITGCPGWGDGSTGWNTSYSDDGGETWTEYQHWYSEVDGKPHKTIVAMASLVQLKDENGNLLDKWMGVYHDYGYTNYKTYLTFDEHGNEQWSKPEPYLSEYRSIESSYQICEVGMFRSPDGKRIVALARSQSHQHKSVMFYSDDEGETWSEPEDVQGALQGERHKAVYDPITGRLVVTFREITLDYNQNGIIEPGDWRAGEWVAWVGTYEDLMQQNEGQYRIMLKEDFAQNFYSGDTGYAGIVVQPDGTLIMNSYGHWDEAFSKAWKGGVTTDLSYIVQAKFKLGVIDNALHLVDRNELITTIQSVSHVEEAKYTIQSWQTFAKALEEAIMVKEDNISTQVEVDQANSTLQAAFAGLQEVHGERLQSVLDAPTEVISGEEWIASFGLSQITNPVQAQDIVIRYDSDRFEFIKAESKLESVKIVQIQTDHPGQVRLLVASVGQDQAIRTDGTFIELTMRAKVGDTPSTGNIEVVQVIVSDSEGAETNAALVSKSITIMPIDPGILLDVNKDGKVSIGDLAIVAAHYGKNVDSPDWNAAKIADVNNDDKIDVNDLAKVARELLN